MRTFHCHINGGERIDPNRILILGNRPDAWNASVRTRGTAADRGRRVRRIVRRVGGNATKSGGGLRDDSLCRIRNCDIMEQDFAVSGE